MRKFPIIQTKASYKLERIFVIVPSAVVLVLLQTSPARNIDWPGWVREVLIGGEKQILSGLSSSEDSMASFFSTGTTPGASSLSMLTDVTVLSLSDPLEDAGAPVLSSAGGPGGT